MNLFKVLEIKYRNVLDNYRKIIEGLFLQLSWWLGEEDCYIELDTPTITQEQINKAEKLINNLIAINKVITVQIYNKDTPLEQLENYRSAKDLPDDHEGDIRVITIDGIDSNMCCGTHVSTLSQLQCVKLLHCEKSKRKGQCLLHFLVGDRVLKRLQSSLEREQKLTGILNNGPASHVELVDKLLKNVKLLNKNLQGLLKDVAVDDAVKLKSAEPKPKYFCLHWKYAEADIVNVFIREMNSTDTFLFLSVGDEKGAGNITLYGKEEDVKELGPKICELLGGKGAGKGNRFQAKVTNLGNRSKAEDLLRKHFV